MGEPKALVDWGGIPLVVARRAASSPRRRRPSSSSARPARSFLRSPTASRSRATRSPIAGRSRASPPGCARSATERRRRSCAAPTCRSSRRRRSANWRSALDCQLGCGRGRRRRTGATSRSGAVYRLSLLGLVEELLASGERRLGLVAERARTHRIDGGRRTCCAALRSVNTPEELARPRGSRRSGHEFVAATGIDGEHTAWGFGSDPEMATELGLLVRDGPKRATASLRSAVRARASRFRPRAI